MSRLLRVQAVADMLAVSRPTVWRLAKTPGFPVPFYVTSQAVAWDEDELRAWLEKRRARSHGGDREDGGFWRDADDRGGASVGNPFWIPTGSPFLRKVVGATGFEPATP